MAGAHEDIDEALTIANLHGSLALRAQALTVRGDVQQRAGELVDSAATLEEAVAVWREVDDRRGEAEALRLWGFTSVHRGELDAAEKAISDALEISRMLRDRRGEAWALQNLAWAAFTRGDNDLAEQRLLASSNLFDEIGDFFGRSWAQGLLGYIWYFKGRLVDAGIVAEGGIEITRESGDKWAHGMMVNLLAAVRFWQGRTREALERAEQGFKLFREIDDAVGLSFASVIVAMGRVLTGHGETALELADGYLLGEGNIFGGFGGIMTAASVHTLLGNGEQALAILDERIGDVDDEDVHISRAMAHLIAGRHEDAYAFASRAWARDPRDAGPRANYACVLSLAAAATGRGQEAVTLGDEVGRLGGTYLDQIRAHIGRALGYALVADDTKARAALDSVRRIADASEDDYHKALARLAESIVATDRGFAEAPPVADALGAFRKIGIDGSAWERVLRGALAKPTPGLFA